MRVILIAAALLAGSFSVVAQEPAASSEKRVALTENAVALDAKENVFVSEDGHLIAAIGVSDLVVIHSGDATLVCRATDEQRIKEIVARLEQQFGDRYS